jgi:hypothetical protein
MKQGNQMMKSMTPQATRFAAIALAVTAVLGTPATAQSVDSASTDAAINRSAPARPAAAKQAAPARNNNAARPAAQANRPAAARPNAAPKPAATSRPAAARPNSAARPEAARNNAHTNTAHSNTAHESRPAARQQAAGHDNRAGGARAGERGAEHGRPGVRNAAYSKGENLHGGHRIAEDRFRGNFGREHQFHIGHPVMIGGQASFQFGGVWFGLVDAWPAAWLYTDAVYVDFVEGEYVLVNVAQPEVTVAVSAGDAVATTCTAEAAVPVDPVVAAPVVVAIPTYRYFTWHYWRHYWI